MTTYAKVRDENGNVTGTLQFPDGTDIEVIKAKVKEVQAAGGANRYKQDPNRAGKVVDVQTGESIGTITKDSRWRRLGEWTAAEGPQLLGGIAGGAAVAASGGTALPLVAGGVAAGGATGESLKQIGQHLSGSPRAPKSSIDAAKRIAAAGAEEGGWELTGGLAIKPLRKVLSPMKGAVKEEATRAKEFFRDKVKPVVFTPAEASDSRVLDVLSNITESSLIGGNAVSKFKTKRQEFFEDFADNIIAEFGDRVPPDELGELFVESVEQGRKVHKEASDVMYNQVSEIIGGPVEVRTPTSKMVDTGLVDASGNPITREVVDYKVDMVSPVQVSTDNIKRFVTPLKKIADEIGSIEAKNAGDDLVNVIEDLPDTISFEASKELRSRLLSRINEFQVINKKAPAIGKAKRLTQLVDGDIEQALRKFDQRPAAGAESTIKGTESALEAWRAANKFYREGQQQFNNTMLRRLIKMADDTGTGAEMIAPNVFRPGQISRVRRVKRAVDPPTWRKMKGFFVGHLLNKSTNPSGDISGKKLINNIMGKPGSFGEPMMKEILSDAQYESLVRLGEAMRLAEEPVKEGTGRVLIQLTQAGAIAAIAAGKAEPAAAVVVFGPAVLSKMMLNPTINKWLTEGITLPASSERAAGILSRLVAASQRVKKENDDEQ